MKMLHYMMFTAIGVIATPSSALAFTGNTKLGFWDGYMLGLILTMPVFLPVALGVSLVIAAVAARRRSKQGGEKNFGKTFFKSMICCSAAYLVLGVALSVIDIFV